MPEPEVKTLEVKSVNDKYKEASKKQKDKDFREKEKKSDYIYWDCWTQSKTRWYD